MSQLSLFSVKTFGSFYYKPVFIKKNIRNIVKFASKYKIETLFG